VVKQNAAMRGERKQVTVMFVDIARSMELTRTVGAERWGTVLDRFLAIACEAIERLGGTAHQFHGDGLMAVFGAPLAHEDHARRACLAALELRGRIAAFAQALAQSDEVEFSIRCGLSSGEVIVGSIGEGLSLDFALVGNTGGLGKRIESLAPEGSIALSAATASLVKGEFEVHELGEFEVKGLGELQRVYELLGPGRAHSRLEAADPGRLSRFVGRRAERAALEAALEQALAGEGHTIGIRGEPGGGKSRLVYEFARDCGNRGLRVDTARAVAYGRTMPLRTILSLLRAFLDVKEGDQSAQARERVRAGLLDLDSSFERELSLVFDFLGLADPERMPEWIDPEARRRRLLTFVGQLVRVRSAREPKVIVIEDLHWIDAGSAAFLEESIRAGAGTKTLIVVTFRPEYEAAMITNHPSQELVLDSLDAQASAELLDELLGEDPSLGGLIESLRERTGGNPFFIEEAVQALAETAQLTGKRGAYCAAEVSGELALPPTVQAVLGARIDRLGAREKTLLQTMSVIGKKVDQAVLRQVVRLVPDELAQAIAVLAWAEFIVEEVGKGQQALAFKHPLTQEVAYASQLSESRSRTHAAVAAAIEHAYPDRLEERAALLAYHSEAAGEQLRAAQWHARAATWAWVSSPEEGMRHWCRVRELLKDAAGPPEAEQLAVLARISILALAWRVGMSIEESAAIHAEGMSQLEPVVSGTPRPEGVLMDIAYSGSLFLGGREIEGLKLGRRAASAAERIGDPGLVLNANCYAAVGALAVGSFQESVDLVERALALAGEDFGAGAGLVTSTPYAHCLWVRGFAGVLTGFFDGGFRDFERSLGMAVDLGDSLCEQSALTSRAIARALSFESELGLLDAERAAELANWAGDSQALIATQMALAVLRVECRDFEGGRAAAERALALIRERKTGLTWEVDIMVSLAGATLGLGDPEGARAMAEEAAVIAERRSLKRSVAWARSALGKMLLRSEGEAKAAEEVLRDALAMSVRIGYRVIEPHIHLDLAAVARLRGNETVAAEEEAEAQRILAEYRAPEASLAGMSGSRVRPRSD
jgi:class 3 adenylate cyclase/tetratricopeptide (TPR) repeat protein